MNFLDAHKLVHDYCDVVAIEPSKHSLGLRFIHEPGSRFNKDELINAYKIFYAHCFLFNTRTMMEISQYEICRYVMDTFVDFELYNNIVTCNSIINDDNILTKKRYEKVLPILKDSQKYYLKLATEKMSSKYKNDEIEQYNHIMIEEAKLAKQKIDDIPTDNATIYNQKYFEIVDAYCNKAYNIAGINISDDDYYFFRPLDVMRRWLTKDDLKSNFTGYEEYIMTNN